METILTILNVPIIQLFAVAILLVSLDKAGVPVFSAIKYAFSPKKNGENNDENVERRRAYLDDDGQEISILTLSQKLDSIRTNHFHEVSDGLKDLNTAIGRLETTISKNHQESMQGIAGVSGGLQYLKGRLNGNSPD